MFLSWMTSPGQSPGPGVATVLGIISVTHSPPFGHITGQKALSDYPPKWQTEEVLETNNRNVSMFSTVKIVISSQEF